MCELIYNGSQKIYKNLKYDILHSCCILLTRESTGHECLGYNFDASTELL